eukprot:scaffold57678_cov40-Cyclotella_meneghiniana.AAC.4
MFSHLLRLYIGQENAATRYSAPVDAAKIFTPVVHLNSQRHYASIVFSRHRYLWIIRFELQSEGAYTLPKGGHPAVSCQISHRVERLALKRRPAGFGMSQCCKNIFNLPIVTSAEREMSPTPPNVECRYR